MELPGLIVELLAGVLVFFVFDFAVVDDDMEFDPVMELEDDIAFEPDIAFELAAGVDWAKAAPVSTAESAIAGTISFKKCMVDSPREAPLVERGRSFLFSDKAAKSEQRE